MPLLDDIGFFLPLAPFWSQDMYFLVWVPYAVLRLIMMQRNGAVIYIRIMFVYGICLFLRALVLNLTILPDPNPSKSNFEIV